MCNGTRIKARVEKNKMAGVLDSSSGYISVLGIANAFLESNPPRIRHCIHCLEAVFSYQLPPQVEAHVRVQLGSILLKYTQNVDLARSHLERSIAVIQSLGPGFEDLLYQSVAHLMDIFKTLNQPQAAIPFLQLALKATSSPIQHCQHYQLLFQLAELHATLNDMANAIQVLVAGEQFAQQNGSEYMKSLFILSRILYLLVVQDYNQASMMLTSFGPYLEMWRGPQFQGEHIRIFHLTLQVWFGIVSGQPKTVRPFIKRLQHSIQVVMSNDARDEPRIPEHEKFQWLPREHLCVVVYLLTVIHCVQGGHIEKSLKYSQKALSQITSLKATQPSHLLSIFELILLENVIVCHIVDGQSNKAVKEVASAIQISVHRPKLQNTHSSMLHTLLGLYAMSMNQMEHAELQFQVALKGCRNPELYSLVALNLCIVYIRKGDSRKAKLEELIQSFSNPERASLRSCNMHAGYYYILGLNSFFESRYQDARRYLRETLKISNAEESHRLTACALILLGHTFLKNGNLKEALDMIKPGMELANKMPDAYIQLWGSSLLRDLYRLAGDKVRESEAFQMHNGFTRKLLSCHGEAIRSTEHQLVKWYQGTAQHLGLAGHPQGMSGYQATQQGTASMMPQ